MPLLKTDIKHSNIVQDLKLMQKSKINDYVSITAKTGLYMLALASMVSPALVALSQLILLIVILINFKKIYQDIADNYYGKFFLLFLILLGVSFYIGNVQYGLFNNQLEQSLDYLNISLFGIIGWIMYKYLADMKTLLKVYIFSILLGIVHLLFTGDYFDQYNNPGWRFTIHKTIHPIQSAMYMSVAVIGLVIFLLRMLQQGKKWSLIPIAAMIVFISYFIVLTQSRGPIIGFAIALAVVVTLTFSLKTKAINNSILKPLMIDVLVFIVLSGLVLSNHNMRNRLTSETEVYSSLIKGDLENVKYNSAGARIHMWMFGLDTIAQNPLLGHGPYIKHLIDASNLKVKFGHIHNVYLEITLRFGLVGLLLFLSIIIWLLYRLFLDWRTTRNNNTKYQFIFYCCSVIVVAVWGLTDYRLTHWENTSFLWLLLGGAYSQVLRNLKNHDLEAETNKRSS